MQVAAPADDEIVRERSLVELQGERTKLAGLEAGVAKLREELASEIQNRKLRHPIAIVALVWLLGHVGFRLGFAQVIEVTDLRGEFDDGLIAGVIMLIKAPALVIKAGVAQPVWLMVGFLMIAIPAAGLSAARPRVPRGEPSPADAQSSGPRFRCARS